MLNNENIYLDANLKLKNTNYFYDLKCGNLRFRYLKKNNLNIKRKRESMLLFFMNRLKINNYEKFFKFYAKNSFRFFNYIFYKIFYKKFLIKNQRLYKLRRIKQVLFRVQKQKFYLLFIKNLYVLIPKVISYEK